jgi:hypothetical protein
MEKNNDYYKKLEKYSAMAISGVLANPNVNQLNYVANANTAVKTAEQMIREIDRKKYTDKFDKKFSYEK